MSKTIGQRIKELREQRGLTQDELGKKIGVEPGVISNYENDKYKPSADTIIQLAKSLEITTDNLLLESTYEKAKNTIADEQWFRLFVEVLAFPPEEKEALKTILLALAKKNKPSGKISTV